VLDATTTSRFGAAAAAWLSVVIEAQFKGL